MAPPERRRPPDKVLLVIIDGVGDVSVPLLGDRTPLQVAHTPNLDALAAAGLNGLMDSVEPGLACGSDTSHMNLLGYDPRRYYRGRGAFESMGAGLEMAPGDIAFKSNFATMDPERPGVVASRRADRRFEELGPVLCAALDGLRLPSFPRHAVSVRYATEHRCGVVVRGGGLTDAVSGTDPLKDDLPLLEAAPLDGSPEAAHTAAVVNELSAEMRRALEAHPANAARRAAGLNPADVVLLRGCGCRIKVPPFPELHAGMRACLVAPTKIIAGLGMSLGVDVLEARGATGAYDSDLASKAGAACAALLPEAAATGTSGTSGGSGGGSGYDFALLHVKAVDDAGHDRLAAMKVRFLEAADAMVGHVIARLTAAEAAAEAEARGEASGGEGKAAVQRFVVCVTGDHSTPVAFGDHSHEPVPLAAARVADAVAALGGAGQLALRRASEKIPMPDVRAPPPAEELLLQAARQERRRAAAAAGLPFGGEGGGSVGDVGEWREAWPQSVAGDAVAAFDEVSAARGALGRFPGSEVMPLLKRLAGWDVGGSQDG